MNVVRDYVKIHLRLIQIDKLEVVILLMKYLIEYVYKIKQRFKPTWF